MRTALLAVPLLLTATLMSAAEPGYRLYVTNERSGDVTVIDGPSHQVAATFVVGKRPRGIQIAPDGKTVYVALSGSPILGPPPGAGGKPTKPKDDDDDNGPPADKAADGIGIIDAVGLKFVRKFPVGSDPEQFALSFDGTKLFIANEDVATASILSLATEKVEQIIPVGKEPEGVSVTPDGRQVFVTCEATGEIVVVDLATAKEAGRIAPGGRPRSVVFTPDSAKGFAASETNGTVYVIDVAKRVVSKTLKLEGGETVRPMG
ncbi:MAG TPA: hypothetical protein VHX44_12480, partial [Planctomycetota bacterium]|nr:hypothetical protein [Planctomycetota bacterium]